MGPETKIKTVILCYFSAVLVIPLNPGPYTFFIDTVGSAVSLTAIAFIFMFYFAVPPVHRTCIHGLSELLLGCLGFVVSRAYFVSLMVNVFHDLTQSFLIEYPVLSCTLFSGRITFVPILLALLTLVMSRLRLLLFTMRFQSLNHKRIVQVCIGLTVGLTLVDLMLSFIVSSFTYCDTINRFARRNNFHLGPNLSDENIGISGSPVAVISFLILVIEMTYQVISWYRKHKVNKVNVLPKPNQTQMPLTISSNPILGMTRRAIPSSNLVTQHASRTRRLSYPMQVTKKIGFRRLSFNSHSDNQAFRRLERSS